YPKFGQLCMWQATLELIRDPLWTWECWGPDTLGAYWTCRDVWRVWTEGTLVEGVSQKVPLQMVERQWGAKKIVGTKKGSHQCWWPTGNTNVHKKWHQFVAIVNRIQLEIEQGKSSTEAIATLDEMCGNDSLPKFFVTYLQVKKGKRMADSDGTVEAASVEQTQSNVPS
ncbi:hypothetical protein JB92DRAFT_2763636, partial [Gautieria morchelliformis]